MYEKDHTGLWVIVVGTIIVVGALIIQNLISDYECSQRANLMQVPYVRHVSTGCMVQVQGQWIPIESYRVVK